MNAKEIQKKIDDLRYGDAWVTHVSCDYFVDEVTLKYIRNGGKKKTEVTYIFKGCYKSNFYHWPGYKKDKPYKELRFPQIPYSMQNVVVNEIEVEDEKLYTFKINITPMEVEIWCKDIEVNRVVIEEE